MAFDAYKYINNIVNSKKQWQDANNAGDEAGKTTAANAAKKYYDKLNENGYADVANQLSASNYDQAKAYSGNWVSANRTESDEKMSAINTNEAREKTNALFDIQAQNMKDMNNSYGRLEDYIYDYNPYDSDIGESIMEEFNYKGGIAANNAAASGAADNGGNIDSFAAANAQRQNLAYKTAGTNAVLADFNSRISNVQNTLNNLGIYQQNQQESMQNTIGLQQYDAQRLFENSETAKNNDVARKTQIAEVTGYSPTEWLIQNDPFFNTYMNADGTLKKEYEDIDWQAKIDEAKAAGNTDIANKFGILKGAKIAGNPEKYAQYITPDVAYLGTTPTESRRQFDELMNQTYYQMLADSQSKSGYSTALPSSSRVSLTTGGGKKSKPTLTASQALTALKNGETSQSVIDAYNYYYGTNYTSANPPSVASGIGGDASKEQIKAEADRNISRWLYENVNEDKTGVWNPEYIGETGQYIAAKKITDPKTVSQVKHDLVAYGYTEGQAADKIEEYKQNIAIQYAKITKQDYTDKDVINEIKKEFGM